MSKIAAVAFVFLLAAGQAGRSLSPQEARLAIMSAEDSRLELPDGLHTPVIDAIRAKQMEDLRVLIELTRSTDASTRRLAVRALGRYERRELTAVLVPLLATDPHHEVITAIAQSMHGPPLPADPDGQQLRTVLEILVGSSTIVFDEENGPLQAARSRALGRLPYADADQVMTAGRYLGKTLVRIEPFARDRADEIFAAARGLEALARRNTRLTGLGEEAIDALRLVAGSRRRTHEPSARVSAMSALVSAGGVDAETLRMAVSATSAPDLRRLAALSLAGAGSPVVATERTEMLVGLLSDHAAMVRLEAVRAWVRQETAANGCERVLAALSDDSIHVVVAAVDALGTACKDDVSVTDRLMLEARTPPPSDNWHRQAHALVSLARRAPERVAVPMLGYVKHPVWQVRMYAAQAAALANDVTTLERLAFDAHHNVREATLAPLRRIKGQEAEPYFLEALKGTDYQLLRTAANELKGTARSTRVADALGNALKRITDDDREVSRDARLALLERLRELGDENQAGILVPLLRDYDIKVAMAASATLQGWTGKPQELAPEPLPRSALPSARELSLAGIEKFRLRLGNGRSFRITLRPDLAPLTSVRFMRLVEKGFYDGLSFHRVVPNFVVQGGSPGANEYAGEGPHMRDEISQAEHRRGTVGLSTRGRDTGDMQLFVNLVDNQRLDFDYTIFGQVVDDDLDVIDTIVEGERIVDVSLVKKDEKEGK